MLARRLSWHPLYLILVTTNYFVYFIQEGTLSEENKQISLLQFTYS